MTMVIMVILVIGGYQRLSVVISDIENNLFQDNGYHGYWWLSMIIKVYLNSAMVILVIDGYQRLSVIISDIENNFHIF